jgi:hypothetical protein
MLIWPMPAARIPWIDEAKTTPPMPAHTSALMHIEQGSPVV